jgi:ribose transport system substrate-binding protein
MKTIASCAIAAMLLASTTAVPAKAENEHIAVFTKNLTNPYFQGVRLGAEQAAKSLGASVRQYVPTKPDNVSEQLSQLEDVLVTKPQAVVFVPVDAKATGPAIQRLNEAKIPVVNFIERLQGAQTVAFVGSDDKAIGYATAKYLFGRLGGKCNIVILEGVKGTPTNQDRMAGFRQAMAENPGIKLLGSQPANYQKLEALKVMENLLQTFPQIDGILAANDAMALGALEASEGAGRKIAITGINATPEAIDAIKSGRLLASGDYNGFTQACWATTIAVRYLRGQPTPKEIVLPPEVVTKDNYQPWAVPVEQRNCPPLPAAKAE